MAEQNDWWAADLRAAKALSAPKEDLERRGKERSIASSEEADKRARAEFILKYGISPEAVTPNRTVPGDTTLSGEDYLKTVDPALAKEARLYIDGRRAFPTAGALRSPRVQQVIDIATQADPTLDAANAATRVATRKDFTSGTSAKNLTSLNTAIGHLASLKKAADALNNTWSPDFNAAINRVQEKHLGDKRVNDFQTAAQAFATEIAKVFKGTSGAPSLSELEDWKARIDPNMSPDQFAGFIQTANELLSSRIEAVGDTYNRGMGKSSDPITLLSPHAQQVYDSLSGGAAPEGKTAEALAGAPEGAQVTGEDVKGWRFSPKVERDITSYYSDPNATAEGYAKLVADKAVSEGHITEDQRGDYIKQTMAGAQDFFKQPPEVRAKAKGVDYTAIDRAATENAGLGTSVAQALRNVPESAYNLATGLLAPATDLVKSAATGKREGIYEAVPNIVGDLTGLSDTGAANELGKSLAEKYGSGAGFKRAMVQDPFGVAADVSIPVTLGGMAAARAPGILGRTGRLAATAGKALDPLSGLTAAVTEGIPAVARKIPEGARRGVPEAAAEAAAFPSGVGGSALAEAYGVGRERGRTGNVTPQSAAFTEAMRGEAGAGGVVDIAREAVNNLREAASQRYQKAMQDFGKTPEPLSPDNLRETMMETRPKNYDAMLDAPHRPADHVAWQQMNDTVEHYLKKADENPALLEPLAVDQFKQDLYTIGSKIGNQTDKDAARIAGGAYRAVRKMLTDHDPIYAKTMKDYADAAQEAAALESGFSLTSNRAKPVNVDAASRKLHSIMRNNANTNFGMRAQQGERLANLDTSGTLMPSLAGHAASSWAPRGLRGNVEAAGLMAEGLHGGIGGLLSPSLLAGLATTSPRAMGELAYGAGRGVGAAQRVAEPAAKAAYDLYNKYPTRALLAARSAEYADELEQRRREEMRQRYGIPGAVPAAEGE